MNINVLYTKSMHGSRNLLLAILITSVFTASLCAVPATFIVSSLADSGAGSLRAAITASNANNPGVGPCAPCNGPSTPNHNIINFTVAGTITPATTLPTITQPVLIDGYSAPGASANTNPLNMPNNAIITVQINGPGPVFNPAAPLNGLRLGTGSSGSTIQGLSITNFAAVTAVTGLNVFTSGLGIRIDSNNNSILGCFLGADLLDASAPNFNAVRILGTGNFIGNGTNFGRNLISGQFLQNGAVRDNGTNTTIQGNTVGLNRAGTAALMLDAVRGVLCQGTSGSKVIGNVISGHSAMNVGIRVEPNVLIQGNFIGTDITGSVDVQPNGIGVWVYNDFFNGVPNNTTITSNVISGNTYGIHIGENNFQALPATATTITGNFIGTDHTGSFAVPNKLDGIWVKFGQATFIGGNTISGNGRHGIRLCKSQMSNIKSNWIGTNAAGANLGNGAGNSLANNGGSGIYIGGPGVGVMAFGDIIGGAKLFSSLFFPMAENNIIRFNVGNGIETNGYVLYETIDGNTISNNGQNGILLGKNASNNVIGSFKSTGNLRMMGDISSQGNAANPATPLGGGNSIFDNGADGIRVLSSDHNVIQQNIITNNPGVGIDLIDSSFTLVGAKDPASSALLPPFVNIPNVLGNIVTGNGGPGVDVVQQTGNATDNSILSNQIVDNNGNGIQFIVG